jgi:hypothetical protein
MWYDKVLHPHHKDLTCLAHKTAPAPIIVCANGGMLHTSVAGSTSSLGLRFL